MVETARFICLFTGLQKAYGTYAIDGTTKGPKVKGKALTLHAPVTDALYIEHLAGHGKGFGVIPIQEDGTLNFAVIDVDDYSIDIRHLAKRVKDLPFVICRSKSGGAHIYVFFKTPILAKLARPKLDEIATSLGFPKVEIFPKQDDVKDDTFGNWINLPYFDHELTTRYAIQEDGVALSLEQFLDFAENKIVSANDFLKIVFTSGEFADGPPCLEALTMNGFPDGSLNNGLFSVGVYARMKFPQTWEDKVGEYNERFMRGSRKEVLNVIGSLGKRDYFYLCTQSPCVEVCNKRVCSKRKYGIGTGNQNREDTPDLGFNVRSVEIMEAGTCIWHVEVERGDGVFVLTLPSVNIKNQDRFLESCLDIMLYLPPQQKKEDWRSFVNMMASMAIRHQAPRDAHPDSEFHTYLEKFCTERGPGTDRDALLTGAPWHDDRRTYFRSSDLHTYLQNNGVRIQKHQVYERIKSRGDIEHQQMNIKGKNINVWSIPQFIEQAEPLTVPRVSDEAQF